MATGKGKFWPVEDRVAWVLSGSAGPFVLADAQTLTVKIDQEAVQTVTLATADFSNIALATAAEVAYVLDRDLEDSRAFTMESANLLVDGDMELAGFTDWTALNSATLSKEEQSATGDGYRVLRVTYNGVASPGCYQAILVVGKEYRIRGYARGNGLNVPRVYCGGTLVWAGTISTAWQYFDVTATATADTQLKLESSAAFGGWVEFDDVSVTGTSIVLASSEYGSDSFVEVTGGTANAALGFSTTEVQGVSDGTLQAMADPQGLAIDLSWYLWATDDATGKWDGQFKILMKQGEYPREHDDASAKIAYSTTYGAPFSKDQQTLAVSNLSAGVVYYFSFFFYRSDLTVWVYDEDASFAWSFPYGQWGHGQWMFEKSPAKDQRNDTTGHWADWLSIFGTLLDGKKTEIEQLKTFYDIPNVRADLIPYHDHLLGWPTNYELDENDQRNETQNVIPLWQKKGREVSVTFQIEQVSGYDIELADGWKYTMLRNVPECIRPDTTDASIPTYIGRWDDRLFYRPDIGHWHNVNGWGVFFFPLATSGVLTRTMIEKTHKVLVVTKPSFVDYDLVLELAAVEEIPPHPLDMDLLGLVDAETPPAPADVQTTLVRPMFNVLRNDVDTVRPRGGGDVTAWGRRPISGLTFDGDKNLLAAAMFNDDPAPIAMDFVRDGAAFGADWTETGTISITADVNAFGGYCVDLSGAAGSFLSILTLPVAAYLAGEGTISLRVKPGYSGSPAADQSFFVAMAGPLNNISIVHKSTGNLDVTMTGAAGIYSQSSAWSPTAGTWYDLELDYSDTAGTAYARLFVDGAKLLAAPVTGVYGAPTSVLLGAAIVTNDFCLDELLIYNEVQHTLDFVPPTEELWGYADVYP